MNDSQPCKLLLMGLPSTGKTSYLAALWYMVNQLNIKCGLRLEKLDGESKYLNEICEAWLQYRPVTRNLLDSEKLVSMALKNESTRQGVRLIVPDLSGESFRLQWTERQLTSEYDEHLREASGGILFVHPEGIVKPIRIDTLDDLAEVLGDDAVPETEVGGGTSPMPTRPWKRENAPTQVQLVELLQFISSREHFRPPFRLVILVSAWDLLVSLNETPSVWVSGQLPLLQQFL